MNHLGEQYDYSTTDPARRAEYILTMLRIRAGKISINCEKYIKWIEENGVNAHIHNDIEARFENELDAVAFKLKFGL